MISIYEWMKSNVMGALIVGVTLIFIGMTFDCRSGLANLRTETRTSNIRHEERLEAYARSTKTAIFEINKQQDYIKVEISEMRKDMNQKFNFMIEHLVKN